MAEPDDGIVTGVDWRDPTSDPIADIRAAIEHARVTPLFPVVPVVSRSTYNLYWYYLHRHNIFGYLDLDTLIAPRFTRAQRAIRRRYRRSWFHRTRVRLRASIQDGLWTWRGWND